MVTDKCNEALEAVLAGIKSEGPKSEFAQKAFIEILGLLPAAPNLPGLDVFCAWAVKGVPFFVDLAIIQEGKVFLTYRDDQYYKGWHFPGFFRYPRTEMLDNCQIGTARELGSNFQITGMGDQLYVFDQPQDPRFHLASALYKVEFEGEPVAREGKKGGWFSEMPSDILPTHACYWPHISLFLYQ